MKYQFSVALLHVCKPHFSLKVTYSNCSAAMVHGSIRNRVAAVTVVLIACSMLAVFLHYREPHYNGVRLRQILTEAGTIWPSGGVFSGGAYSVPPFVGRRKELQNALHGMSEEAFPILLQEMQSADSKLRVWFRTFSEKYGVLRLKIASAEERRERAWCAFVDLTSVGGFRPTHDTNWRGFLEFDLGLRRDFVLKVVEVLEHNRKDVMIQENLGWFLYMIAAESRPAIPYLQEAAARNAPYAKHALRRIREEEEEASILKSANPGKPTAGPSSDLWLRQVPPCLTLAFGGARP